MRDTAAGYVKKSVQLTHGTRPNLVELEKVVFIVPTNDSLPCKPTGFVS